MQKATLDKTLEELDGENWGEPEFPSRLVTECHRLRRIPLREFMVENLRIVVGQKFSLEYLVPLALKQLTANPFVSGDHYDGDLLLNVASIPQAFWDAHPQLRAQWQPLVPYAAAVERYLKDDSSCFPTMMFEVAQGAKEACQPAYLFLIPRCETVNNRRARRSMLRKRLRLRGNWKNSA